MPTEKIDIGPLLADLAASEARALTRDLGRSRDRHKAIHEARKAVRRLRAVLHIGLERFDDHATAVDRSLRALGRGLSTLRDAHVAVVTAKTLVGEAKPSERAAWNAAITALELRRDGMLTESLRLDPEFRRRIARVQRAADAIAAMPWKKVRKKDVRSALTYSSKRVHRAAERAREEGTAALVHDWRRRVRRERLQLQALHTLRKRGGVQVERVNESPASIRKLTRIADQLGWQQDLRLLKNGLRAVDIEVDEAVLGTVRHAIAESRT
ncbi:CHAD domain-containing protein [Luteibacter sp. Sphag1AF]|uniref:CHAD domain-containing protein n=1 Tax=Luteibacter sp. Sphag1AF TaxID=2587031 RepID=UPI0016127475|nr:CHAD domain-containing protein [Luteibacter sp. Sphag1AF]MBB3226039.1 CHAD domain-containing protein [Luteibacter sp. Sphag1AF]